MNFGELTALIADDLIDERLSNVQIQNAINQAIRFYSRKTFYFNTLKDAITTVADQEYYSATNTSILVADLYTIQTVRYQNGEVSVALRSMADKTMENLSPMGAGQNLPSYYAYAQMQLRLLPPPREVGTLTIIATRLMSRLTEDTETNAFLERADELIRQAAKRYLSYNVLHDSALGDRSAAMEAEEFASLRAETMAREPVETMQIPTDLYALAGSSGGYDIVMDQ